MHNNDENIIFIASVDDERGPLGVFSTIGTAIAGAEHILKGDRVDVERVVIGINDDDFVARVVGSTGIHIDIRAIEIDNNHSIDGIVHLEG
jgi:hypothetical protein